MGSIENILLLNFAILICSVKAIKLCEVEVNVTHGTVATQGEPFNITLTFNGVVKQQSFSLTPEWDRLFINQSKIQLIEDSTVDIQMFSNQFYLYKVFMSCVENKTGVETEAFEVPVSRTVNSNRVARVFQIMMTVCLSFAMLLMGCELDIEIVKSYMMKPLGPLAGMVCQYLCMPLMAYFIGYIFLSEDIYTRYGLILVGCCPGGSFSNFWAGNELYISYLLNKWCLFLRFSTLGRRS